MSDWSDLGLPNLLVSGYAYVNHAGLSRTPFSTAHPRQSRLHSANWRTVSAECFLTQAQLSVATEFLEAGGFSWFSVDVITGALPSNPVGTGSVRLSGDYQVSSVGWDLYKLSLPLEYKPSIYCWGMLGPPLGGIYGLLDVDPEWLSVIFQMSFDTNVGGTYAVDKSSYNRSVTLTHFLANLRQSTGYPTGQLPTAVGEYYPVFLGTTSGGGEIRLGYANTASKLIMGTDDFTITFWMRMSDVFSSGAAKYMVTFGGTTPAGVKYDGAGGFYAYASSLTKMSSTIYPTTGDWHLVQFSRSGDTLRLDIGGDFADVDFNTSPKTLSVGSITIGVLQYGGLDTIKIVGPTGVVFESATFDNGLVDLSSDPLTTGSPETMRAVNGMFVSSKFGRQATAGNSSAYYVAPALDSNYDLRLLDFTIEFWHRHNNADLITSPTNLLVNPSTNQVGIRMKASRQVYGFIGTSVTGDLTRSLSSWHHYALVRKDRYLELYLDGVPSGSPCYDTKDLTSTSVLNFYPGNGGAGSLDSIRVTKGVARYTAAFTPPTRDFFVGS